MPTAKRPKFIARTAHKHELYERAVQNVDVEAPFIDRLYRRLRGRPARSLREDFCGTASLCCAWVRGHATRTALGVDLDEATLQWGRTNRLAQLTPEQRQRVTLVRDNVLHVRRPQVDVLMALNFSYFVFKTREMMRRYLKNVHASLGPEGVMMLDAYGGWEAQKIMQERRRCAGGFTYIWEHADYDPISAETLCHIHFEFPDGSRRRKAFSYDWRLWTLVELREILEESGFSSSEVHWEGTERDTGEGNGIFRRTTRGESIESWIAYLVAMK